jgi:gamma-glutamylcyclotransferase (GGCT)/AIG2-like uncharacterized protein YtfP
MPDTADIRLFSYGTLQLESVQLASFGRRLDGQPDTLQGYTCTMVEITDADVLATSGQRFHPIVRRSDHATDEVQGMVFRITAEELAAADRYEVADYQRVQVRLASGLDAWVYVKA